MANEQTNNIPQEYIVLPDYSFINTMIPTYDGNPKNLNYYIRSVESVISSQKLTLNDTTIACLIRAKLSGKALEALSLEVNIDDWNSIKSALVDRFKDQRSEAQLLRELVHCPRSSNETCETYGKRLRELLDAICSITDKSQAYYQSMAIDTFLHNIDSTISILVKITQPKTLVAAISTARQEENQIKIKNKQNINNNEVKKNVSFAYAPRPSYNSNVNNNWRYPPHNFVRQNPNFPIRIKQETPENKKALVPIANNKSQLYQIKTNDLENNTSTLIENNEEILEIEQTEQLENVEINNDENFLIDPSLNEIM